MGGCSRALLRLNSAEATANIGDSAITIWALEATDELPQIGDIQMGSSLSYGTKSNLRCRGGYVDHDGTVDGSCI